jgi:hypothetical protein
MIKVNNIFSIGYRCNVDDFLGNFLNIRKYSSPFSYMVVDIKTALHFIENNFENYTKPEFISPGKTFKFNKYDWGCNNIHNISKIDCEEILNAEAVCIWNHHNLYDPSTINSFDRRSTHLLECLNKTPETTLLFYIEKIQNYGEKDCYFDKNILQKYNCKFLILIPLLNFNSDPILFYEDDNIKIIYFKSNLEGFATEIFSHQEEWLKLKELINKLYEFNINTRP